MERITFDSGVKTYQINDSGLLRFNPSDPNLYARFLNAVDKLQEIEKGLEIAKDAEDAKATGETIIRIMAQADMRAKKVLSDVFGKENNFDDIFGGVNILAVAGNGERVISNFLEAMLPIIQDGAEKCARSYADVAVKEAEAARAAREAL